MATFTLRNRAGSRPRQREAPRPQWLAAIGAGVVAGVAFVVLQSVLASIIYGESVWAPFHRIAAMAVGSGALEDAYVFVFDIVLIAAALHFGLSAFYGLVYSYVVVEFSPESAPWIGAIGGVLIYLVNFYGFTGLYPWMAEMRGIVTLFTHAVFGGLLAACYWSFHSAKPRT